MTAARRILPAGAVLATVLAACGSGGPKVALRYHPPTGAVYHYAFEQHSKIKFEGGPAAGMGEQQLTMHMFFTQQVGAPSGGQVQVTMTFDSISAESPMLPPAMMEQAFRQMRGMKTTALYDDQMRVQHVDFSGAPGLPPQMSDQITGSLKNLAFPFPDHPVGAGDSWDAVGIPSARTPGKCRRSCWKSWASAKTARTAMGRLRPRRLRKNNPRFTSVRIIANI